MTEVLAKRLLDLVIMITEKYWGYSLIDICDGILETNKLTAEELVRTLTPSTYYRLEKELRKKYIDISQIKKLIRDYEIFFDKNKKAQE